ncbi:MAG: 50S ribosomal protein L24 [Bacteroidota bacterium]
MRRTKNPIAKLHVKKDDQVKVIKGDDRGAVGRVLSVDPIKRTAIVEDVKMITKHQKPSEEFPQGERVKKESPIRVDNLMVIDPKSGEPTRIGRKKTDNGWVRVAKKSGEELA